MSVFSSLFALTDEQAMWRVQKHDDSEAFAQLLARWEEPIKRLCTRMLCDPHKAEDATQEAFARIYTKRQDYQHGAKFSTFLWRVATNLCLDELRRVKRRQEFSLVRTQEDGTTDGFDQLPGQGPAPNDALETEEKNAVVRDAVARLPEHYRAVVVLRHYENLKFREIADVLEVPEGTVKSRMAEALTILHQSIQRSWRDTAGGWRPSPPAPSPASYAL